MDNPMMGQLVATPIEHRMTKAEFWTAVIHKLLSDSTYRKLALASHLTKDHLWNIAHGVEPKHSDGELLLSMLPDEYRRELKKVRVV